jgi:hypothetical protein
VLFDVDVAPCRQVRNFHSGKSFGRESTDFREA